MDNNTKDNFWNYDTKRNLRWFGGGVLAAAVLAGSVYVGTLIGKNKAEKEEPRVYNINGNDVVIDSRIRSRSTLDIRNYFRNNNNTDTRKSNNTDAREYNRNSNNTDTKTNTRNSNNTDIDSKVRTRDINGVPSTYKPSTPSQPAAKKPTTRTTQPSKSIDNKVTDSDYSDMPSTNVEPSGPNPNEAWFNGYRNGNAYFQTMSGVQFEINASRYGQIAALSGGMFRYGPYMLNNVPLEMRQVAFEMQRSMDNQLRNNPFSSTRGRIRNVPTPRGRTTYIHPNWGPYLNGRY